MSEWAERQPEDGDIVLRCGHTSPKWHWFRLDPATEFKRPDGTNGYSHWIVSCPACAITANFDAARIQIRADGTWLGNAPVIPGNQKKN